MTKALVGIEEFKKQFAVVPNDATHVIMDVELVETPPEHVYQPDE